MIGLDRERRLALRGERVVRAPEVQRLHADRLRLRLGLDALAEAGAPLLPQHRLGHRVAEGRAVREFGSQCRRRRQQAKGKARLSAYEKLLAAGAIAERDIDQSRRTSIGQREVEYQSRARGLDSTMQTRQAQLVKPIMERVQSVIEAIRSEDGYAMIFDVGSQTSVIVAADKNLDITDKVMARMKAAPRPAATPAKGNALTTKPAGVSRPPDK